MTRLTLALAAASASAWAQFHGLATPNDGSAVYFTTTARLRGAYESPWGKVFVADERGVQLVEQRELRPTFPTVNGTCAVGRLYTFTSVEVSGDAQTLAAQGSMYARTGCAGSHRATLLRTTSGSRDRAGTLPSISGVLFAQAGRAIADDGTVVLNQVGHAYRLRPGSTTVAPMQALYPTAMSANGRRLLYFADGLHLLDIVTQADEQLSPSMAGISSGGGLSDDGARAVFVDGEQLYAAEFGGGGARRVSDVPDGIATAVLSGNGKVAYAVTATGRLVRIEVESGVTTEIVARTAEVASQQTTADAGGYLSIGGSGFADRKYAAAAPLPVTVGGVSVTVDGRPVPVAQVAPDGITALLPWDTPAGPRRVVVVGPQARSPFADPEITAEVRDPVGLVASYRENWSILSNATVRVGEVIHVYALGLGPVQPEVAPGQESPSTEPLARLVAALTCSNSEVLFAGLVPKTITRLYQVDVRIGPRTEYQVVRCSTGSISFDLLKLYVNP